MVERVGRKLVCIGRVAKRDGDEYMEAGCGAVMDLPEWDKSMHEFEERYLGKWEE